MPSGQKNKEKLTKSKERIAKFAEVYTPSWLVKDMCDILQQENSDVNPWDGEHTILEPACGNGNFLVEIVERKLALCHNIDEALKSLNTIFGVDLLPDNIQESKERMYAIFVDKFGPSMFALDILNRNIVCGNFLTKRCPDGTQIWFLED